MVSKIPALKENLQINSITDRFGIEKKDLNHARSRLYEDKTFSDTFNGAKSITLYVLSFFTVVLGLVWTFAKFNDVKKQNAARNLIRKPTDFTKLINKLTIHGNTPKDAINSHLTHSLNRNTKEYHQAVETLQKYQQTLKDIDQAIDEIVANEPLADQKNIHRALYAAFATQAIMTQFKADDQTRRNGLTPISMGNQISEQEFAIQAAKLQWSKKNPLFAGKEIASTFSRIDQKINELSGKETIELLNEKTKELKNHNTLIIQEASIAAELSQTDFKKERNEIQKHYADAIAKTADLEIGAAIGRINNSRSLDLLKFDFLANQTSKLKEYASQEDVASIEKLLKNETESFKEFISQKEEEAQANIRYIEQLLSQKVSQPTGSSTIEKENQTTVSKMQNGEEETTIHDVLVSKKISNDEIEELDLLNLNDIKELLAIAVGSGTKENPGSPALTGLCLDLLASKPSSTKEQGKSKLSDLFELLEIQNASGQISLSQQSKLSEAIEKVNRAEKKVKAAEKKKYSSKKEIFSYQDKLTFSENKLNKTLSDINLSKNMLQKAQKNKRTLENRLNSYWSFQKRGLAYNSDVQLLKIANTSIKNLESKLNQLDKSNQLKKPSQLKQLKELKKSYKAIKKDLEAAQDELKTANMELYIIRKEVFFTEQSKSNGYVIDSDQGNGAKVFKEGEAITQLRKALGNLPSTPKIETIDQVAETKEQESKQESVNQVAATTAAADAKGGDQLPSAV